MVDKNKQDVIRKDHPKWEFPDFEIKELATRHNRYCVCIFVINEGERVQKQLKAMSKYWKQIDIVVADGGSTDGSLSEDFLKQQNVRALLIKKGKGKLSAQMRMAFAWALNEGYEGVIVVDGNGKDDISAIPNFIKHLDNGFDHIQGSRFVKGGHAINTPLSRELGLHLLHAPLISIAAGKRHTDTTNGFRAYSSRLLSDPEIAVFRDVFQTYELHYHLAIESSRRKQYKTIETPVTRAYPKSGKTPTKISPIKGNLHILRVLFSAVAGKYRLK
jgi:dolichol-phosphate mannosyltransferase